MDGVVGFRHHELARLRAARGITLDAVARAVGVADRSRVSHWESGAESPRPAALVALAVALVVDPLELLDGGRATPKLATLRSAAGLTRGQAAARVGMSRPAYLRLDAGRGRRDLPASLTAALASAYGVDERTVLNAHARSRGAGDLADHAHHADHADHVDDRQTLRELRSPHTATDVAAALGITERTWYRLEAGRGRRELPATWTDTLGQLFGTTPDQVRAAYLRARQQATGENR